VLVGRQHEQALLGRAIREARAGASGVLVLLGEPGIGKTALLEQAAASCDGLTLLRGRGLESESELPFAALGELLGPLLPQLGEIPAPQAHALAVALALERASAAVDRLAVCAATLGLLARGAVERPILALVDDAHSLDEGSAQALVFAARRFGSEGIAMLVASRGGDPFEAAGLPALQLAGLDAAESALLLERASERIAAPVARRLAQVSDGNPLALIELPRHLSEAQRAGHEPLDEPVPAGPALERAFGRALLGRPDETRAALLLAAASGTGELRAILRACAASRLASDTLVVAETSGLVAIHDGRVTFRHPLLRSVVYHSAMPVQRRHAHAALASALADAGDAEECAWHRAAAAVAADEAVARAMAAAAERARARGAPATSARGFERAARLTPDALVRAQRLCDAALEHQLAGRPGHALALLDEVRELAPGSALAVDAEHLSGRVATWLGRPLEAHERIVAAAAAAKAEDPARAALALAEAVFPCLLACRIDRARETAREAFALSEAARGRAGHIPALMLAFALQLGGREAEAEALLGEREAELEGLDPLRDADPLHLLGRARMFRADAAGARRLLSRIVEAARKAGAVGMLPFPLASLAELDFRVGHFAAALAEASESVQLATETGQATDVGLLTLGLVEAALGMESSCREHVARGLEVLSSTGNEGLLPWAGRALGLLALGLRRPDEACRHLDAVARFCTERGLHSVGVAFYEGDFVEANVLAGREREARVQLEAFEARARSARHPAARAAASRCAGLLAAADAFDAHFAEAFTFHAESGDPFERARTALAYGERLRRERRRREAIRHLEQALDAFQRIGALHWSERVREELRSCGERVAAPRPSRLPDLTPLELQVALVVARGATNREAGAKLFLSEKTIETHLSRVYRKLAVRSRTELANVVLAPERAVD
jgi:DNA-binding CsgD family transcriptional regulator